MSKLFVAVIFLALCCSLAVALVISTGQSYAGPTPLDPGAEPQFGSDIQVNPTVSRTPAVFRNHSLAINPTNPNHVISSYESAFSDLGVISYGWSNDGGLTWGNGYFHGPWYTDLQPQLDTHVAFDANGTGYYSVLAYGSTLEGYFILTTTNGTAWGAPVPVALSDYSESRYISNLVVDDNPVSPYAGSVYMFWLATSSTQPFYRGIRMRYSRDGGLTWSQDKQVSDSGNEYSFGAFGVVASNGTVYAAFQELDNNYIFNQPKLFLDRSTNGGGTWGTDTLITGAPIVQMGRPDYKNRELTLVGSSDCTLIHANHYPSIGVLPDNPNKVYAVWNDGRWESVVPMCDQTGRHSDIAFSSSADGGQTWTAPLRLNDDPTGTGVDHFHPVMDIRRADGLLGVTWIDRRYDPDHYLYDLVYAQSSDGGSTWTPNRRVSDFSSNPNAVPDYKGLDDLGLRNTLAFGPDYVLPGWLDTHQGTNEGDFFTDRGVFPAATATPTPIGTATPTRTSTRTATPTRTPLPPDVLEGHVTWQSRPQPDPLSVLPITLTLKQGSLEFNYQSQTDPNGSFFVDLAGVLDGAYNWRVKGQKFLANAGSVQIQRGANVAEMGLMKAGDCNNDNVVNLSDFNILKVSFGKAVGDPGYDDRADLTGDGRVNVADFTALKANFGQGGAPAIRP